VQVNNVVPLQLNHQLLLMQTEKINLGFKPKTFWKYICIG